MVRYICHLSWSERIFIAENIGLVQTTTTAFIHIVIIVAVVIFRLLLRQQTLENTHRYNLFLYGEMEIL